MHIRRAGETTCADCGAREVIENGSVRWLKNGAVVPFECPVSSVPPQRSAYPMDRETWEKLLEENRKLKEAIVSAGVSVSTAVKGFMPFSEYEHLMEENKKLKEEAIKLRSSGHCACTWRDVHTPVQHKDDVKPCGAHRQWLDVTINDAVEERVKAFTEEHDRQCKHTGELLGQALDLASARQETIIHFEKERDEARREAATYRSWYEDAMRRVTKYRRLLKRVILAHSAVQKVLDEE